MSDEWEFVFAVLLLLLMFVVVAVPYIVRDFKRHAAMPDKNRADGSLDEADEAVRRWRAAHRLPKCQTCKHWLPMYYGGKGPQLIDGICQRYPRHLSRRRRTVLATDSCGEHQEGAVR